MKTKETKNTNRWSKIIADIEEWEKVRKVKLNKQTNK
jgi:hypothetical protein